MFRQIIYCLNQATELKTLRENRKLQKWHSATLEVFTNLEHLQSAMFMILGLKLGFGIISAKLYNKFCKN